MLEWLCPCYQKSFPQVWTGGKKIDFGIAIQISSNLLLWTALVLQSLDSHGIVLSSHPESWSSKKSSTALPYSDKRRQLLKMTFLVNEQNLSVMYIGIRAISLCLDFNIFQQDGCFCSKLGLDVEHAKSNLKTSLSQIWMICDLLPFVRVRQCRRPHHRSNTASHPILGLFFVFVFFMLGNRKSQMVPNQENMEGDQPVQSHSHAQQPMQPQTCAQENCPGKTGLPSSVLYRPFWNVSSSTIQRITYPVWVYPEGNNSVRIRKLRLKLMNAKFHCCGTTPSCQHMKNSSAYAPSYLYRLNTIILHWQPDKVAIAMKFTT